MKAVSLMLVMLCLCLVAWASEISSSMAVKAVLGEAGGLSAYEQGAICHAIRNRGHLRGVYGLRSTTPRTELERTTGLKTWVFSGLGEDYTKGATHWLSKWDLEHCRPSLIAWRNSMDITLKTKHFTFYKERG
jgi:hypothetical protein